MMDTSPEYVEMCEKAVEIQKLWPKLKGDFYTGDKKHIRVLFTDAFYDNGDEIWLPRQDQLQKIIGSSFYITELVEFADFVKNRTYALSDYHSLEQLYLVYLMKEKFNKVWNGKDWEKNE